MDKYYKKNRMKAIELYKSSTGEIQIEVRFEQETVWLTQKQLAEVFDTTKQNIGQHIRNIIEEGELDRNSVVKFFFTTASDGKNYNTEHYNLDMIISLGYRINSKVATKFRQWATQKLKDYLTKGYAINQKRLDELNQLIQIIEKSETPMIDGQFNETKGFYGMRFLNLHYKMSKKISNNGTKHRIN
jgi:DNA integrity scanning protein DisA with diadenylate cyclase activity